MKKQKMKSIKEITMAVGGVALVAAAGLFAGATIFPTTNTEVVTETIVKEIPVETVINNTIVKEVPVEKIVEKTITVNDKDLLEEIFVNDGDVEYLLDEVEDDTLDLIVENLGILNDGRNVAENVDIDDLAESIEDFDNDFNKDYIEDMDLNLDIEDIDINDIDYEDEEFEFEYEFTFEYMDVDYEGVVKINVKDLEVDDIEVLSINEE